MKINVPKTVISGVVLAVTMATPVLAATHTPAKMTCGEFLALDDVVRPKVVFWAEGFNNRGKPVDAIVDVEATDRLVPVLVEACKENPKLSFWQKTRKFFSSNERTRAKIFGS
jgi:hypothetical protein